MLDFLSTRDEILKNMNLDEKVGLNEKRVIENREKYGVNAFTRQKPISMIQRILETLKDPMILMLIFAFLIAVAVNIAHHIQGSPTDFIECIGIFFAVVLSVAITVIMEGKSAKAFEAISKINEDIHVRVIRNSNVESILQKDIVVGDIVLIETGDKLPADGRILESVVLNIDEAPLTGESLPVEKNALAIIENEKTTLAERINMVYSGCFVTSGNGKMIVTSVGDSTEFGKIASELSSTEKTTTPLQEKLTSLGKKIAVGGVTISLLVFIIHILSFIKEGNLNFINVSDAFIASIILIVAAIPEGLPTIVAVSLSVNIIKMSKQNALVKKMVACETIGSINVVCSDKTGTFTENRMTLTDAYINGECFKAHAITDNYVMENFAINSTAHVNFETELPKFLGNPTECALLVSINKSGGSYMNIREEANVLYEYPFSSETKNMTTIASINGHTTVYTKGSPEKIFSMCNIDDNTMKNIQSKIMGYQEKAQRIIAFAHKDIENKGDINFLLDRENVEGNMIYDGFVAITDPIRPEVYDAVNKLRSSGIDIKMLTGDNIITASAIATELGMLDHKHIAIEAKEIESMSDEALTKMLPNIRVIARSTPTIKMRVVNSLKLAGHVVAVTGDGINDAPAIKNADVGISMGITGTEVSKEASDIVLLDDSFATIVKAVQWGRGIYENFQRFIQFQLTVNVASVSIVFISTLMGLAAPFTALQLLWVNIIMDGPPALALGLEPIRDDLMKRMPVKRDANIVTKDMFSKIIFIALSMILIFMTQSELNILKASEAEKSTVLFTLFVIFQLFNSLNSRELGNDTIFKYFFNNKLVFLSIFGAFVMQIIVTQFGGALFHTTPLSLNMWLKVILLAFSVTVLSEIFKVTRRLIARN